MAKFLVNSNVERKEYISCCAGIHVRKMATILAIIFFTWELLSTIGFFGYSRSSSSFFNIVFITIYALIIFADKYEKPWAYWPYLIIKGIFLFFAGIFITFFIFLGLIFLCVAIVTNGNIADTVKEYGKNYHIPEDLNNASASIILIIFFILMMFYMWFQMWQWVIVYKARKYMVHEIKTGNVYQIPVQEQRDLIKKV